MLDNCWKHDGECLSVPPEGYYGFIYVIRDNRGWVYFGKKAFTHQRKVKTSKKVQKETRKRVGIRSSDSQWMTYWGSCKPLLAYIKELGNTEGFSREVIKLCKTRQDLAYWEIDTLIKNNVLFRDDCWNGNVSGKWYKGKITA